MFALPSAQIRSYWGMVAEFRFPEAADRPAFVTVSAAGEESCCADTLGG